MRPDDGAVDHVPATIRLGEFGQGLQHRVPHAAQGPAPKPLIDAVPLTVLRWKLAPLRARPRNPQHALEILPVVVRRPTAASALGWQKRRNNRPFFVGNPDPLAQRSTSSQDESLNQKPSQSSSFVNKT
jgi:hypothetical protein